MHIFILFVKLIIEIFKYIFNYKDYDDFFISLMLIIGNYNIIFIKIFQWIWMNDNYYVTKKIENQIHIFTNNTPYTENDIDYKNLLHLYKTSIDNSDNLQLTSLLPINSGTISLVFKAKLNEKDVVIKILRKDIKNKINSGLNLLINLENILYNIPFINYYVSTRIFNNNKNHIFNQVNFLNESKNISLFYNKFKNNKLVLTPTVYEKYTKLNNKIIVMDFIKGKYLYELNQNELSMFFEPFFKFILISIFKKKIYHCDLHQGNVLFINELLEGKEIYKIGIIDFGMITNLNTNEIDFIYLWINVIFNDKFKDILNYIKEPNNLSIIFDNYEKINDATFMLNKLYDDKKIFVDLEKSEIIIENIYLFLNILKKFNCKISSRYNFFILSLIPIFTFFIALGPNVSKTNTIKEIINKIELNNLLD